MPLRPADPPISRLELGRSLGRAARAGRPALRPWLSKLGLAAGLAFVASAAAAPQPPPLLLRCNALQMQRAPNRQICRGDVVLRRGALLVCCDELEGEADDNWRWRRVICRNNVRAAHGDDLLWADRADLSDDLQRAVLTGRPSLRRGNSLLEGSRIEVGVRDERARVVAPRARLFPAALRGAPVPATGSAALPERCPLPPGGPG